MVDDTLLMDFALKEAWKYQGLTYPNPAVGAVVSNEMGTVISCKAHQKAGLPHAEVEAIKDAYIKLTDDKNLRNIYDSKTIHDYLIANHRDIFKKMTLYVTLEPCNHHGKTPPCSHLIKELKFQKVIIGVRDSNKIASGGADYLAQNGIGVEILKECKACENLLFSFKKWQESRFVFFKLAMSLNGVIDGGIITGKKSRELVHRFRDRCDLLVIGGNTVRIDRPILDARLCDGKAPDILIYSKKRDFDKTIPLFSVKGRRVFIESDFKILDRYKNIMIEGGEGMLKATRDIVDMYAIFHSPNFKKGKSPKLDLKLDPLFCDIVDKDRLSWFMKM